MLGNFSPEKNTHHLHVFQRKFIENLTELPNFMVLSNACTLSGATWSRASPLAAVILNRVAANILNNPNQPYSGLTKHQI
jgi:hypothetical protein